jgi:hypothetical protein
MRPSSALAVVRALELQGVRAIIVGGYAVIAHGVLRSTHDLDLVLDFADPPLAAGLAAIGALGFKPRAPVPITDFADTAKRIRWQREMDMQVFGLWRDHPGGMPESLDIFIDHPFDFDQAWRDTLVSEVQGQVLHFVDLDRLLAMKRAAGRDKDLADIRQLEQGRG